VDHGMAAASINRRLFQRYRQERTKTPDFPTSIPNGGMDNIAIIGARSINPA